MHDKRNIFFLVIALLLTAGLYSFGLHGDFLFDDFPQIVLNKALFPLQSYADFVRIWHSGNTGPGGRPIPVLSFAVQIALSGVNPFYFKLINLIIHLGNGVLVYFLAKYIALGLSKQCNRSRYLEYFPVLLAAWWLLSPMGLSTVLYAVQRMTSLSATFSLSGLLWYLYFRRRDSGIGLLVGGAGLVAFTALSFLSKEIGMLTFIYAYLLEWLVLQWKSGSTTCNKILAALKYAPVLALLIVGVWLWRSYSFELAYSSRPFTLLERVLTEARILWFYVFQMFIPNVSWLTFYHDDFVISQSLLDPPITFFAVLGHVFLLSAAAYFVRSAKLLSFGILWFYGGHLLESTVFPLELIFEHRNYLPMLGVYTAVLSLPFYFAPHEKDLKLYLTLFLCLMAGAAFATAVRATDWGSPMRVLIEAEHKPNSARANFDAGAKLLAHLREDPEDLNARHECERYFKRAIAADTNHLAAFPGLIELAMLSSTPLDEGFMQEFEARAAGSKLHPAVAFTVAHLDRLAKMNSPQFDDLKAERIFQALLSNSTLLQDSKGHVLTAKGRLLGRRGDYAGKRRMLEEAVAVAPATFEFHLLYIESLFEVGDLGAAKDAMAHLERLDKYGYYKDEVGQFHDVLRLLGEQ